MWKTENKIKKKPKSVWLCWKSEFILLNFHQTWKAFRILKKISKVKWKSAFSVFLCDSKIEIVNISNISLFSITWGQIFVSNFKYIETHDLRFPGQLFFPEHTDCQSAPGAHTHTHLCNTIEYKNMFAPWLGSVWGFRVLLGWSNPNIITGEFYLQT